uniref:Uncharacterized protein n=1 Tax=Glossina austeni TaxID=7395 RepID=A0A1A9V5G5_GLOAU
MISAELILSPVAANVDKYLHLHAYIKADKNICQEKAITTPDDTSFHFKYNCTSATIIIAARRVAATVDTVLPLLKQTGGVLKKGETVLSHLCKINLVFALGRLVCFTTIHAH